MDKTTPQRTPKASKQAFQKWMIRRGGAGCWGLYCWLADPAMVRQQRTKHIKSVGKGGDTRTDETRVVPKGTDPKMARRFYGFRNRNGDCMWEAWLAWVEKRGPRPFRDRIWGKERKTPKGVSKVMRNRFHAYKAEGGKMSYKDWEMDRRQKELLIPKGTDPVLASRFRGFMRRNQMLARYKDWFEWMMGRGAHPKDLPPVMKMKEAPETNLRGLASRL